MKILLRVLSVSALSLALVAPASSQQQIGAATPKAKVPNPTNSASSTDSGSGGTSDKPPRYESIRLAQGGAGGGTTHDVPEIDPGLAGSAAVLLVGGLLLLTDRRRRTA